MLAFVLCMFLLWQDAESTYVLVLKNKQTMTLQGPPTFDGQRAIVTLENGSKTSLPRQMLDMERTAAYNKALAEKRHEEAKKAALVAAEAKAKAEAAKAKKPPVVTLRRTEDLPEYDASRDRISGMPTTDDSANQAIGDPEIHNYEDNGKSIYLAKETLTRYPDRTVVVCEYTVNDSNGVENPKVTAKLSFEDSGSREQTQLGTPSRAYQGGTVTVRFEFPLSEKVLSSNYNIEVVTNE